MNTCYFLEKNQIKIDEENGFYYLVAFMTILIDRDGYLFIFFILFPFHLIHNLNHRVIFFQFQNNFSSWYEYVKALYFYELEL